MLQNQSQNNLMEQNKRLENAYFMHFPVQMSATQTLFRVQSMSCFPIVLLAKNVSFVTVLLFFYVVTRLVYPNCTHSISFTKIATCRNFLGRRLSFSIISRTVHSRFTYFFAYVYPIPHSIRQKQSVDTEHLYPLHF